VEVHQDQFRQLKLHQVQVLKAVPFSHHLLFHQVKVHQDQFRQLKLLQVQALKAVPFSHHLLFHQVKVHQDQFRQLKLLQVQVLKAVPFSHHLLFHQVKVHQDQFRQLKLHQVQVLKAIPFSHHLLWYPVYLYQVCLHCAVNFLRNHHQKKIQRDLQVLISRIHLQAKKNLLSIQTSHTFFSLTEMNKYGHNGEHKDKDFYEGEHGEYYDEYYVSANDFT
jgi:hypothetical protein